MTRAVMMLVLLILPSVARVVSVSPQAVQPRVAWVSAPVSEAGMGSPMGMTNEAGEACCPMCAPEFCPCVIRTPEAPPTPHEEPMRAPSGETWFVLSRLSVRTVIGELPPPPRATVAVARSSRWSALADVDAQSFLCLRTT